MSGARARRSRTIELSAEPRLAYVDSSALVKLVIEEPESVALGHHLAQGQLVAVSRIALVEVLRATEIANPTAGARTETDRLLNSCMLVDVTNALLRTAAGLASASIRTLDAIHLASALRVEADELVAYDRRLAAAADEQGLAVASPGVRERR